MIINHHNDKPQPQPHQQQQQQQQTPASTIQVLQPLTLPQSISMPVPISSSLMPLKSINSTLEKMVHLYLPLNNKFSSRFKPVPMNICFQVKNKNNNNNRCHNIKNKDIHKERQRQRNYCSLSNTKKIKDSRNQLQYKEKDKKQVNKQLKDKFKQVQKYIFGRKQLNTMQRYHRSAMGHRNQQQQQEQHEGQGNQLLNVRDYVKNLKNHTHHTHHTHNAHTKSLQRQKQKQFNNSHIKINQIQQLNTPISTKTPSKLHIYQKTNKGPIRLSLSRIIQQSHDRISFQYISKFYKKPIQKQIAARKAKKSNLAINDILNVSQLRPQTHDIRRSNNNKSIQTNPRCRCQRNTIQVDMNKINNTNYLLERQSRIRSSLSARRHFGRTIAVAGVAGVTGSADSARKVQKKIVTINMMPENWTVDSWNTQSKVLHEIGPVQKCQFHD